MNDVFVFMEFPHIESFVGKQLSFIELSPGNDKLNRICVAHSSIPELFLINKLRWCAYTGKRLTFWICKSKSTDSHVSLSGRLPIDELLDFL